MYASLSLTELVSVISEFITAWSKESNIELGKDANQLDAYVENTIRRLAIQSNLTLTPAWIVVEAWAELHPSVAVFSEILKDLGILPISIEVNTDTVIFHNEFEIELDELSLTDIQDDPEALALFTHRIASELCDLQYQPEN